ncbi:PTS sugar transporter subunit IIC [Lentilactobacillus otakiensis]|uniref:Membrane protein, putative toxin regulator n=1 Tax=Lentilactobacillus otakiensis DSM 19908 = JCM 15040 TaxID=1423780 RepID=S4NJR7_9LACO|nr:PTS sugar transporter subunit IIC [Lentilactobacillus otakiensis]KRL10428.1 membrane protein, putative toxin regulator [Lentilactobacillus otakiensis DSM 19908 = JCM 15040]MDV3518120.1 PTS sugar transporter subunit IIC [Lentilactobacillus otakiensis]GAD16146.1 membrane protein, putative toxin regulator [Lentilactobacillus otakiensis DSM 19908 = JCM 15040]
MNLTAESSTRLSGRDLIMNTLNGLSIGIIVALVPGALLNQLLKALLPVFPQAAFFLTLTGMAAVLMAPISAVCVGMMAGFSPIQTSSLALAAIAGAGNFQLRGATYTVAGSGDVINIAITIMIGYLIIALLGQTLKAYTILLIPLLVLIIAGGIGVLTLKPVGQLTQLIGMGIEQLTQLQPIVMGVLIGMVFAVLIVSPISSVGIAAAIGINGVAAGSANLGIVAASFALAIYGWRVNSVGTSLAHFLGSPKMQMANILSRPKLIVPVTLNAGIMGGLGALFGVAGTPMSAGFGFAGLIGPIAAVNGYGAANLLNIGLVTLLFFVIPIALGIASNYLFNSRFDYFDSRDFELDYS